VELMRLPPDEFMALMECCAVIEDDLEAAKK
jgi:hypothetical protein